MMKKKRNIFNDYPSMNKAFFGVLLSLILSLNACQQGPEYRFQDEPKVVACSEMPEDFMHELLYSFREDIGAFTISIQTISKAAEAIILRLMDNMYTLVFREQPALTILLLITVVPYFRNLGKKKIFGSLKTNKSA